MIDPIFAGIDIETTGLLAADHRIIEIYVGLYRSGKKLFEFERRIDPQRAIGADAQRVHHISSADLIGKPPLEAIAADLVKVLTKADFYVWHNGDEFDGPFLDQELKRVGHGGLPARPAIDTMIEGVWATSDGKKPRLSELCFACGVDYDPAKAHAASYDVDVMMGSFFNALSWGFFKTPGAENTIAA